MGSDNLHHKRKQRARDSYKRKISQRASYDIVLIVCEGKKTEPYYLREFCDSLKLNSANIKIIGVGVDPLKLVDNAEQQFNESKDYDRVFCVFDKDQHSTYQNALNKVRSLRTRSRNSIPIYSITSVPCFEYWLLLHFIDSARPFEKTGNKSSGEVLLNEIGNYIKNYYKGHKNIFEMTKANLEIAINRAKRICEQQANHGTDNPSTNMYELIEYLRNIKKN